MSCELCGLMTQDSQLTTARVSSYRCSRGPGRPGPCRDDPCRPGLCGGPCRGPDRGPCPCDPCHPCRGRPRHGPCRGGHHTCPDQEEEEGLSPSCMRRRCSYPLSPPQ